jgi:transcriptional regulator with XRE-family HTH domain
MLFQHFGQTIRTLRIQKRISLNAFAEQLGVSTGYLSNLETGKTDTIPLHLLATLQQELGIFVSLPQEEDPFTIRANASFTSLRTLHQSNEEAANYLLESLEKGTHLFSKLPQQQRE